MDGKITCLRYGCKNMDQTIILKEKCPRCGESLSKFIWSSDCRGNPGGSEIVCSKRCYYVV